MIGGRADEIRTKSVENATHTNHAGRVACVSGSASGVRLLSKAMADVDEIDDFGLLELYARAGSQEAFARLVKRHVDKVYSAAQRQVRNPQEAEEVTQAVFVALARKARMIDRRVVVAGWLIKATHLAARDLLKAQSRRRRHELHAAELRTADMSRKQRSPDASSRSQLESRDAWALIAPLFDGAIAGLATSLRDALVLRFFENRSYRAIGQQLGITEEAARKRVERGLRRLRATFAGRGVMLSADAVGTLLLAHAVSAAPAGMAGTAMAAAAAAAANASHKAALVKGMVTAMAWSKAKIVAACAAGLLLAGGTGVVAHQAFGVGGRRERVVVIAPGAAAIHTPAAPAASGPFTLRGIVRTADGRPVSGGGGQAIGIVHYSVMLYGDPSFASGEAKPSERAPIGADGAFTLSLPSTAQAVIVSCPEGFAAATQKEFAKTHELTVKPWGRVQGRLIVDGEPVNRGQVMMGIADPREANYHINVLSGPDGRYEFPQAPAGAHFVSFPLPGGLSCNGMLTVESGPTEIVDLILQGGRRLTGRLAGAKSHGEVMILLNPRRAAPKDKKPGVFYPHGYQLNYMLGSDPSFALSHVPPGDYEMGITLMGDQLEPIGQLHQPISVPELKPGESSTSIDLGTLTLKPYSAPTR